MNQPPLALRYTMIAALCFVASNLIVVIGAQLSLPMPVGVTVAFGIVGVFGYLLHGRHTFRVEPSWLGFGRYITAISANLPLSVLWIWLFADVLGWPMPLAAPTSSACMLFINFLASRWAICGARKPAFVTERS